MVGFVFPHDNWGWIGFKEPHTETLFHSALAAIWCLYKISVLILWFSALTGHSEVSWRCFSVVIVAFNKPNTLIRSELLGHCFYDYDTTSVEWSTFGRDLTHLFLWPCPLHSEISQRSGEKNRKRWLWRHQSQWVHAVTVILHTSLCWCCVLMYSIYVSPRQSFTSLEASFSSCSVLWADSQCELWPKSGWMTFSTRWGHSEGGAGRPFCPHTRR